MSRVLVMRGKQINVALAIWYQVGIQKKKTIVLSRRTTKLFKATRRSVSRAIKRLEEEGLIFVQRRPGRLSLITVLDLKPEPEEVRECENFEF
jgi:DNA-binding MarR family transcriptional regulator